MSGVDRGNPFSCYFNPGGCNERYNASVHFKHTMILKKKREDLKNIEYLRRFVKCDWGRCSQIFEDYINDKSEPEVFNSALSLLDQEKACQGLRTVKMEVAFMNMTYQSRIESVLQSKFSSGLVSGTFLPMCTQKTELFSRLLGSHKGNYDLLSVKNEDLEACHKHLLGYDPKLAHLLNSKLESKLRSAGELI